MKGNEKESDKTTVENNVVETMEEVKSYIFAKKFTQ